MNEARPAGTPRVTVIVVSYNTREMTLACLRSVFEQTARTPFELIVVDNQSGDGSAEAIEAEFAERVHLIRAGANLGFAAANNLAAGYARGEYLLLLNPDTVVLDEAIDKLVAFAQANPDAGVWGGRTLDGSRKVDPTSCWRRTTPWGLFCRSTGLSTALGGVSAFNSEGYGGWARDSVRHVDIVTGCFLLVTHDLWRRLGGFDRAFFMYGEEADLCLRAQALGARPLFAPEPTIIHFGGASRQDSLDRIVRMVKAQSLLIERHWSRSLAALGDFLLDFWMFRKGLQALFGEIARGKRPQLPPLYWAAMYRLRRGDDSTAAPPAPDPLAPKQGIDNC